MADDKITEAVLDPVWRWGTVDVGGVKHPFIGVTHPRHGTLSFIVPKAVVRQMIEGLSSIIEEKPSSATLFNLKP